MVFRLFLLNPSNVFCTSRRAMKSYDFKPHPRPYKRRLYEATLAPIVPKRLEQQLKESKDPLNIYSASLDEQFGTEQSNKYELALVEKVRGWIEAEQFRVMAICQQNATKEETLWLAGNRFRLNGVEFCNEPAKILRKVFERSRLSAIVPLLVDECTCLLFGKDPEQCIHSMVETSAAYAWIKPIAFVVDCRFLPMDIVSAELKHKDSLMRLRRQTVQTLEQTLRQIPSTMDGIVGQLTRTLDVHLKSPANAQ